MKISGRNSIGVLGLNYLKSLLALFSLLCFAVCAFGQSFVNDNPGTGLSFEPDRVFNGPSLTGWNSIGQVKWSAKEGQIRATGASDSSTGLLVFDQSFQDIGLHVAFKCPEDVEAGFIFRLEKTETGFRGLLVSIHHSEVASYKVILDRQGKLLQRNILRNAGGTNRIAPPAREGDEPGKPGGRVTTGKAPDLLAFPLQRPETGLLPNNWNQIEVFLDENIIRSFLNDGEEIAGGATDPEDGNYGPFAFYMTGKGEVCFKDISYKDLSVKTFPKEQVSPRFITQIISDLYYSWGVSAGDYNRDGDIDIVSGPMIFYGPDFTKSRTIYPEYPSNPNEFANVNCQFTFDFDRDGWPDILNNPPGATLYFNPKNESRRWDKNRIVDNVNTEVNLLEDLDQDGFPEFILCADGCVSFARPNPAGSHLPWKVVQISEPGYAMAHGLGVGDIDGDGRKDVLNPNGWWQQPEDMEKGKWIYHPVAFGRYAHRSNGAGGSIMGVYDANGDGLTDVITSLNAHGFGLAWFEQKRDNSGRIYFERHMISDDYSFKNAGGVTFSQPHGSAVADIDGDGIPDYIVGKRYWSHRDNYLDPDAFGPPVLYWYRTVRNPSAPGGAEFVPELIHNRSGAGSHLLAVDIDKNGTIDIVSSNNRGTFIFWNRPGK